MVNAPDTVLASRPKAFDGVGLDFAPHVVFFQSAERCHADILPSLTVSLFTFFSLGPGKRNAPATRAARLQPES